MARDFNAVSCAEPDRVHPLGLATVPSVVLRETVPRQKDDCPGFVVMRFSRTEAGRVRRSRRDRTHS